MNKPLYDASGVFRYVISDPSRENSSITLSSRIEVIYFLDQLGELARRLKDQNPLPNGISLQSFRKEYFSTDEKWYPLSVCTISFESLLQRTPPTSPISLESSTTPAIQWMDKLFTLKLTKKRVTKSKNLKAMEYPAGSGEGPKSRKKKIYSSVKA